MLTYNTVFILGAGASKPFGFPTGAELKNNICEVKQIGEKSLPKILIKASNLNGLEYFSLNNVWSEPHLVDN